MSRQARNTWAMLLAACIFAGGCQPVAPFYLSEKSDLGHYLEVATELEYPDVQEASLAETAMSQSPLMLSNPEPHQLWNLTLEEAIQISLNNGKVLKQLGANVATTYDPAIQETDVGGPNTQGVEAALSQFDAQLSSSLFWDRSDRPSNSLVSAINRDPRVFKEDRAIFAAELHKQAATGTRFALRNNTIYEESNVRAPFRALPSDWLTSVEAEVRQPLARGAGTQVNRTPVMLARIRTDISLADFECSVRDHVFDVERAYWELYFTYRKLDFLKWQRNALQLAWRHVELYNSSDNSPVGAREGGRARQEYFEAQRQLEAAQLEVFQTEKELRFMLGLSPTDGRLIRPVDEPPSVQVHFDWCSILNEALCRNCELRINRWQIKQREMEMIQARNQLLPQVDAVALYRWLGRGDDLFHDADGPAFPGDGSDAFEELLHGRYEEWRVGVEMKLPVGFRRELAGMRNAQLQLARERALLQEAELLLAHRLTGAVQDADGWYTQAQTSFNRMNATREELDAWMAIHRGEYQEKNSYDTLDQLIRAIQRHTDAFTAYYRFLTNYTVSLADIHARKGSLLQYNNVLLAEGPWPDKALYDAQQLARQRSAGHYINYGFTRPRVISQGLYEQFPADVHEAEGEFLHDSYQVVPGGETIPTPDPLDFSAADEAKADAPTNFTAQPAAAAVEIKIAPAKAAIPTVNR